MRAVLSIGSNLGDRQQRLAQVSRALGDRLVAASSVYQTAPWGGVEQPEFLNAVLIAEGPEDPWDWLRWCQQQEQDADRVRTQRWGPRSLDVDIISLRRGASPVLLDEPGLQLPHPRAADRAFVLVPWLEIEPDAELPGHGPVARLLARLPEAERRCVAAVGRLPGTEGATAGGEPR